MTQSAQELSRRIGSAKDLHTIVRTMKALAAVNIRQYETVVAGVRNYEHTIRLGLSCALRAGPPPPIRRTKSTRFGLLGFGTDQGMCGPLNRDVAERMAQSAMRQKGEVHVGCLGGRLAAALADHGLEASPVLSTPHSSSGLPRLGRLLLATLDQWTGQMGLQEVRLIYTRHEGAGAGTVREVMLVPLDKSFWTGLHDMEKTSRSAPMAVGDREALLHQLIRLYLHARLYLAASESLASENAARLMRMQGADKNVRETLEELEEAHQQARQASITGELLDVVSGFEALRETETEA